MPPPPQYSDQLSDQEREFGFEVIEVDNHDRFAMEPDKIPAVIYRINSTDRVVKLSDHLRGGYQIERYGRFDLRFQNDQFGWQPISQLNLSFEQATYLAKGGKSLDSYESRVTPEEPGENY